MIKQKKTLGIWGFGIVGKAAYHYFYSRGYLVEVFNQKPFLPQERALFIKNDTPCYWGDDPTNFLQQHDYIMPSAGIDLRPFAEYKNKFISEVDFFDQHFKKPIIAVTGSVGKTTVVHILDHLFKQLKKTIVCGGNIGKSLFSLLDTPEKNNGALLELSSFQLELCTTFAPDVAIITNVYPNHLDRHGNLDNYFAAKYNIIKKQNKNQKALVHLDLATTILAHKPKSSCYFFSLRPPTQKQKTYGPIFYYNDGIIKLIKNSTTHIITKHIPDVGFTEHWLIVYSTLHILNINSSNVVTYAKNIPALEHRLEKVATINGATFYNDSKATTPASTLAAVNNFAGNKIILFLGGLSKGADRAPLIKQLKNAVKKVVCFGKDAHLLHKLCIKNEINSCAFTTLEQAFTESIKKLEPNDVVLFSPSGSSFDLFDNFAHRGTVFKTLVQKII